MIQKEDVFIAYKKLKSYVYYENFSLSIRIKIAEYEDENIDSKLSNLYEKLIKYSKGESNTFSEEIGGINCSVMPKSFSENENDEIKEGFFYSNENKKENYYINRVTPFIDCSIELHIISIVWIMFIGNKLDDKLGNCCFGNRLHRNNDNDFEVKSIKLFKKYYLNYTEWRDQGIKKAKEIHNLGLDVAILNLDLKNYYNSIDYNISTKIKTDKNLIWLNNLLNEIHNKYSEVLYSTKLIETEKKTLPIGLISSSILANYYLIKFDDFIINEKKPAFYGRYVDDIVMVFANPKIAKSGSICENFITDNLINNGETFFSKKDKTSYAIKIEKNEILFQQEKVKLFYFLSHEPINLLDEFEKEIKNNSSEFKFEPESQDILSSFEKSSYRVSYTDTINKLRSVDGLNVDKLGASKHLSKLINATKISEKIDESILIQINKEIRGYFSGSRLLELNSFWEKLFTFYIINNSTNEIIDLTKEIIITISRLRKSLKSEIKDDELLSDLQVNLVNHLIESLAMASSLNKHFFNEALLKNIKDLNGENKLNKLLKYITLKGINKKADSIIMSNLFRHNLIYYPLVNYCKQKKNYNFLSKHLNNIETNFEFDSVKIKYSPRFINYHEFCLFHQFKTVFKEIKIIEINELQNIIFNDFMDCNSLTNQYQKYENAFPKFTDFAVKRKESEGFKIEIQTKNKKQEITIGIVNVKVNPNNSLKSMKGTPNLDYKRFDEINHVLNESIHWHKSDLIIFPEISVPYQWLPHITSFAKKNNIAIICGLEHMTNIKNEVLNYVVTILPFSYNGYKNSFVDFRLKKDYSPNEEEIIEGWKYKLPTSSRRLKEKLRLYKWNNISFSVFNCFELTDIRKRAIFRGKVDFIATVEHNHDVNYFSNITESISRDIHAFIIQVNTSDYGDSRITRPSDTKSKDLLKIKGGDNISLITNKINIQELRDFQQMNYNLQSKNTNFKFTPPNFLYERD